MADKLRTFKASLDQEIKKASKVFITGHIEPDYDAIGASLGIYSYVKKEGKDAYIIVNDSHARLSSGVMQIIEENKSRINFINKEELMPLVNKKSILIIVDTNKKNLISTSDMLDKFNKVIVIDHHHENIDSVDADLKYINMNSSSASEIVGRILTMSKTKYSKTTANYLLAGISLDTDRFKKNTSAETHDIAEKLINRGADIDYVNSLFLQDFESFCNVSSLIIYDNTIRKIYTTSMPPVTISFSLNRKAPHTIYLKEDCAKASDRMMKFIDTDASFVMCYVDEENVHVSARGGKRVNVGKVMESLGGGGNFQSAGALLKEDIFKVEENLMEAASIGINNKEDLIDNPKDVKILIKR